MDVVAIRSGLSAACAAVTGLRASPTVPSKIDGPTAVVNPDDTLKRGAQGFIEYNDALAGGLTTLNFEVVLLVPIANGLDRAQNTLDGYLSAGTGQGSSVPDALNAAVANGHLTGVDHVLVETARGYGSIDIANSTYAVARLALVVRANRR